MSTLLSVNHLYPYPQPHFHHLNTQSHWKTTTSSTSLSHLCHTPVTFPSPPRHIQSHPHYISVTSSSHPVTSSSHFRHILVTSRHILVTSRHIQTTTATQCPTTQQWELTCTRESLWQVHLSFFAGMIIGSSLFQAFSDKFGRKSILICNQVFMALAGVASAVSNNFRVFCFFRFLTGAAQQVSVVFFLLVFFFCFLFFLFCGFVQREFFLLVC